jgi:septum formation protein
MMALMEVSLPKIYLASGSPRRKFLLETCGLTVERIAQDADETWPTLPLGEAIEELARRKMNAVQGTLPGITVSADTAVVLDGDVLGKPATKEAAVETLNRLSGRAHTVISGVCVATPESRVTFSVQTQVWFRPLEAYEIDVYVNLGESMDKAGAYGIQGHGAVLVDRVEGSYTNVVGLPVAETLAALRAFA